jgi:ricin-type beta-trefoil lectin protein
VTDEDHGEEQDPLLVRPYLHADADAPSADRSTQTWPAATTREVRSQRALEGADDPTAIIPAVPPEATRRRFPRRLIVVLAACAAVLLGATAAGLAAMHAARPATTAAQPDAPIPALSGLVPASPAAPPAGASASPTHRPARHRSSAATATSARTSTKPSATASSGAVSGKGAAPSAALQPATARTGTIRGQNGLCLDLNGGVAVAFNHIQVFTCNGTAAQTWTLDTDGTLRVQGMCAMIVGDDTVHIIACDGRTTAQWRADGQLLINASNGECLTDPSGGTQSGTAVKVATCNGSANQRWSIP